MKRGIRTYLFVIAVDLVLVCVVYMQYVVGELRSDLQARVDFAVESLGSAVKMDVEDAILRQLVSVPIIVTDVHGKPQAWKHVGVDPNVDVDIVGVDVDMHDTTPEIRTTSVAGSELKALVEDMDRCNLPILLKDPDGTTIGHIHYSYPDTIRQLVRMRAVTMVAIGLLIFIGILGFRNIKNSISYGPSTTA